MRNLHPGVTRESHHLVLAMRGRWKAAMIKDIMTVRLTEAELARDVHAVLEKVRQGFEVVIEQDNRPVAVLKSPQVKGRNISEVIASLEASGASAVLDEDFGRDVESAIGSYREPWKPPSWD
jgi:antitoxin (DNA-binding transcriptional repressor) of toxin-antitoxin stability system